MDAIDALAVAKGELGRKRIAHIYIHALGAELVAREGLKRARARAPEIIDVIQRSSNASSFWSLCENLGLLWQRQF